VPKLGFAAVLAACLFAAPGFALAQAREPAGHVLWAFGQIERIGADGAAKTLTKGDPVFEGDVIRSGPGSSAQLIMTDDALLALRAESSFKLTKYRYRGREDGAERAMFELLKGGMRSITGVIGRRNKDSYELKNETSVIGIRGTDHETFATGSGTYNRVTLGGTYLQSPGGRVDLAPGEVGFVSLAPGSTPMRLERTPEFMHFAAVDSGNTGPRLRGSSAGDERRLERADGPSALSLSATSPVLPAQLGESNRQRGWGQGGRCEGPCAAPHQYPGRGRSK
jgi:FecR protein